jgi:hypothetical protein
MGHEEDQIRPFSVKLLLLRQPLMAMGSQAQVEPQKGTMLYVHVSCCSGHATTTCFMSFHIMSECHCFISWDIYGQ